jgi:arylsulfatase
MSAERSESMAKQEPKKPNILLFHVDNISVGDFGCYGGAYPLGAKTPNIDRFAGESLQLTNYNVEAQCSPSRSALMTGRHPVRTGCITALLGSGLVAWEVTIADKLKALGYSQRLLRKMALRRRCGKAADRQGF